MAIRAEEEVVSRRNTILGIALGLAIAAIVPMAALAKPVPANQGTVQDQAMELGLSQGKMIALGLGPTGDGVVAKSPDDRSFSREAAGPGTAYSQAMELGLSQGKIIALGLGPTGDGVVANSPDDRSFSKATNVDPTPVVIAENGRSIDVNPYTVTGFGLALLLAVGFGLAIGQSRRTKLSPA
jgi:hypothetical protein